MYNKITVCSEESKLFRKWTIVIGTMSKLEIHNASCSFDDDGTGQHPVVPLGCPPQENKSCHIPRMTWRSHEVIVLISVSDLCPDRFRIPASSYKL